MDSEMMYKQIVKEQQQKNKINNNKTKDFVRDEKNFEEAYKWKNFLSKKMNS